MIRSNYVDNADNLNEFYPKVVFRLNGDKELLASGTTTLAEGEFILEPTREGFGVGSSLLYIGYKLDHSVLVVYQESGDLLVGWLTHTGGFNDFTFRYPSEITDISEPLGLTTISDVNSTNAVLTLRNSDDTTFKDSIWDSSYAHANFIRTGFVERGDLLIHGYGTHAFNKQTGDVEWVAVAPYEVSDYDADHVPSLWSNGNQMCISSKYAVAMNNNRDGYYYIIDLDTGEYVYYGDFSIDYPEENLFEAWSDINIFPRVEPNEFIIAGEDFFSGNINAVIMTVNSDGTLSFERHPAEGVLDPWDSDVWTFDAAFMYPNSFLIASDGSYYYNREGYALQKFNSDDTYAWSVDSSTLNFYTAPIEVGDYIYLMSMEYADPYIIYKIDKSTGTHQEISIPKITDIQDEIVLTRHLDQNGYIYMVIRGYDSSVGTSSRSICFAYLDTNTDTMHVIDEIIESSFRALDESLIAEPAALTLSENGTTMYLFERLGKGVLAIIKDGAVTYKDFGHSISSLDDNTPIVTNEGDIFAIQNYGYNSYANSLVKIETNGGQEFTLPSNPGISLVAGETYSTPEDDWYPGKLYPTIRPGTIFTCPTSVSIGDYIVMGAYTLDFTTGQVRMPVNTIIGHMGVWDEDNLVFDPFQSGHVQLYNPSTNEMTHLVNDPTFSALFTNRGLFRRSNGDLILVQVGSGATSSSDMRLQRWTGTGSWSIFGSTTKLTNSYRALPVYFEDKCYVLETGDATNFYVKVYDFSTDTWTNYDSQPLPAITTVYGTTVAPDIANSHSTYHEDTVYFGNTLRYHIPTKTFSEHPVPMDEYLETGLFTVEAPVVVYKDVLFRFTPYGVIHAQPLINTTSPY